MQDMQSTVGALANFRPAYSEDMETGQQRAMDAAIELVGTQGLRALTHRRVDEHAGLPAGSTSNYARTRAALVHAVMDRIIELEARATEAATMPATAAQLLESMARLIDATTGERRVLSTARLILFMEASHDERLRERVTAGRVILERFVTAALQRLGAGDPQSGASALMACAEGIILHRIVRQDRSDARPALRLVLSGILPIDPVGA